MRIGERFNIKCASLTLDDCELQFVTCIKYLGVHILASKHFSCCIKNVRMKFYGKFNSIYKKSIGANYELSSVHLSQTVCHLCYMTQFRSPKLWFEHWITVF